VSSISTTAVRLRLLAAELSTASGWLADLQNARTAGQGAMARLRLCVQLRRLRRRVENDIPSVRTSGIPKDRLLIILNLFRDAEQLARLYTDPSCDGTDFGERDARLERLRLQLKTENGRLRDLLLIGIADSPTEEAGQRQSVQNDEQGDEPGVTNLAVDAEGTGLPIGVASLEELTPPGVTNDIWN
jgi:hypothetical protein